MKRPGRVLVLLAVVLGDSCGRVGDRPSAALAPVVLSDAGSSRQELAGHFSTLRDPSGRLTIDDVRELGRASAWRLSTAPQVNFGYTRDAYWTRLTLQNDQASEAVRILELPPPLDSIDLYVDDGHGGLERDHTGKKVPFSSRQITSGPLAFRLMVGPGQTRHVWLRMVSKDSMFIYPVLWSEARFAGHTARRDLTSAVYSGALGAMVLFNLFIWFSLRDRAYLYYALFQSAVILTLAALEHTTFRCLWPGSPDWASRSEAFFVAPALFAGSGFTRSFLGLRFLSRAPEIATRATMAMAVVLGCVALLTDHPILQQGASLSVVVTCAVLLWAGVTATVRGSPNGHIFVGAWIILLLSGMLAAATSMGLLEWQPLLVDVPRIGSTAEAVLLSIGLARRIKIANNEKEQAQQQMILTERAQSHVLELRVIERTRALEQAITQLRGAQEQMIRQARLAALGHLIAGVAHEIGNPLNFVSGGAKELARRLEVLEIVLRGAHPDLRAEVARPLSEAMRATKLVENGSVRIHRIIESLRSHRHSSPQGREAVDVIATLEATLALIAPLTDRTGIEIVRDFAARPSIMSSPGDLDQVFLNLLLNGCQAMPTGGKLSVRVSTTSKGAVEIEVADSGPGIAREHREAIFDPFFTTRLGEGTGLGLSLSLRIVEQHGGDLRLVDSPEGATFLIRFPPESQHPRSMSDSALPLRDDTGHV